jgi:CheY-like chemotaxis protein
MTKLLLIEDDPYMAQRISEYLSDSGFDIDVVRTTQDALSCSIEGYGGAIIDVMLPNDPTLSGIPEAETRGGFMAGVALVRKLRQREERFPVVLLSADVMGTEAKEWAKENGVPYVWKHEDRTRLLSALSELGLIQDIERPRSFIVHGHDEALLTELKDYLQNVLKWPQPTVLREEASAGRTIIEKFEQYAGMADWVFVLISPDDPTFNPKTNDEKRRARQNVIFELGFFYGLLGRLGGRVIVLRKGDVELPSDIDGIVWIDVQRGIRAAGEDIRAELGA